MNANELADKLQELDSKLHLIELFIAATMLRQQQAEIANLKAGLLSHHDIYPVKESYMDEVLNNTLNMERNHNEKASKELYELFVKQQEKLNKYELRNMAQCDRIAILEAQLKQAQEK